MYFKLLSVTMVTTLTGLVLAQERQQPKNDESSTPAEILSALKVKNPAGLRLEQ